MKVAIYTVKYDRQPLRFVFKYYRPADQWRLQDFRFTDSFDEDLEAAVLEQIKSAGKND